MKSRFLITAILGMVFWAGVTFAEETIVGVPDAIAISNPGGATVHYLLRPEIDFSDTTIIIDWATLELTVSPQTEDTITFISIRVYPIAVDWNPDNVAWDSPWINPGGDFDNVSYAEYAVSAPGTQTIAVDLTDLCMRWADARLPYYGFLISVSEASLAPVEFLNGINDSGPFATLRISYTSIPSEP